MKRRRQLVIFALAISPAVVAAGACSFPDAAFGPDEGGVGDSPAADSVDSPVVVGDGGLDVQTDVLDRDRASDPDAPPPIDATSEKPPIGACDGGCDCDNDSYRTKDAACATTGPDCDDQDTRAHPGADYSDELPTIDTKGDWNCVGGVERLYGVGLKCPLACVVSNPEGFLGDPGCGQSAPYYICLGAVGCAPSLVDNRKQKCR